jgi:surfeit locus 1 family protein
MTPRARGYLFFGITLVLAAVFVRLGVWQLSRLAERRAYNRKVEAARALAPVSLDSGAAPPVSAESLAHRRVRVTGEYDPAGELVLRGQSEQGVAGVRLVTPLRIAGKDSAVLVQRGFVPSPDAMTVDQGAVTERGVQAVEGIASLLPDSEPQGDERTVNGQTTWRRVDLAAARRRVSYPLLPILILQTPDSGLPASPRRDEAPSLDDGPHLSYAIQWLAFAITALVAGVLVGLRGVRSEK